MPDLLLELFSEEIPARMQAQASDDLRRLVTDALVERGLTYEGAAAQATPRRLALHIAGLPVRQPDTREERKGPRVGAPEQAVQGFLKSAGLASLDQAKIEKDPKGKGEFYVAVIERAGRATEEVLAEVLPQVIRGFPWPKSMRWGANSSKPDALRWVRPLHAIVATFGPETETPEIVRFSVDGIESGDVTFGHRFLAPGPIQVRRWDDYVPALQRAKVVLDPAQRRDIILHDAKNLAMAQGLELVEDEALLAEVAGLVEWPVVLMGEFDESFLEIPAEVIRATIRANQKCFVLRRAHGAPSPFETPARPAPQGEGSSPHGEEQAKPASNHEAPLANKFILVSNIEATDGGTAIAAGNGRVVRARLSDALYFWQTDRKPLPDYADKAKKPLDQRLAKLRALNIVFHEKLGTQGERIDRIMALAQALAPIVGADPAKARRAAELAKADLVTEVVGEFPETQGLMGRRYAELQGEDADVAAALEEHYKPQGPSDRVPTGPVSIAVALADKIDTLVGFWAIDEKPTGSKDPYALRRAALGVIRLVLENGVQLGLLGTFVSAGRPIMAERLASAYSAIKSRMAPFEASGDLKADGLIRQLVDVSTKASGLLLSEEAKDVPPQAWEVDQALDLLAFFHDRLKVYLRDKGARHDLIDAVLASGETNDDLLMIVRRVEALAAFLDTEDGKNLLAGYKRAANILRAEEKKDGAGAFDAAHDPSLRRLAEENALAEALGQAETAASARIAAEDFAGAMQALAALRAPVDAFFDKVTVNDPEPAIRANRLRLLNELRRAMHAVADFSKIAG